MFTFSFLHSTNIIDTNSSGNFPRSSCLYESTATVQVALWRLEVTARVLSDTEQMRSPGGTDEGSSHSH